LPRFSEAQCVGINPDPEQLGWGGKTQLLQGWSIQLGTGHDLLWPDGYFDLVLCNSVLEHDPAFWKTLAEMKRVLKGHIVIGVPAFVEQSRAVLQVHRYPKDYYRFGEDAVREVFFEGLNLRDLQVLMLNFPPPAPRILAWGDNL
jgi:ubiquinone/menaquinone biosynthesis C-methylase UbiE